MAAFCYDCTAELFGEEVAAANDMVHDDARLWDLCEHCGWQWFGPDGKRLTQFSFEEGMAMERLYKEAGTDGAVAHFSVALEGDNDPED
jgi:hypothetical protein